MRLEYQRNVAARERRLERSRNREAKHIARKTISRVVRVVKTGDSRAYVAIKVPREDQIVGEKAVELLKAQGMTSTLQRSHCFECDCEQEQGCILIVKPYSFWKDY